MAYSHDAFPKDQRETSKRLERERQDRDGAMADGLTLMNELASKREMNICMMA